MGIRAAIAAALLCACHAAAAGECGSRMALAQVERLTAELQQGASGLAAYGDSLASRPEANSVTQRVQELVILHERIGRVALLIELRDAMRHEGEKSFVQFKLSHEASLLKLVSSRARANLGDLLAGRPGIREGVARLREAIARAEAMFAMCDSPM